jgi:uncharacterized protein YcfL
MNETNKSKYLGRGLAVLGLAASLMAAHPLAGAQGGAAAKVMLRGEPQGVEVSEMRVVRRNETLIVQTDLKNSERKDRQVFYRFKWLDSSGMQVGDGEPWKQLTIYGQQVQTLKGIAPTSATTDFRLEMNVEAP